MSVMQTNSTEFQDVLVLIQNFAHNNRNPNKKCNELTKFDDNHNNLLKASRPSNFNSDMKLESRLSQGLVQGSAHKLRVHANHHSLQGLEGLGERVSDEYKGSQKHSSNDSYRTRSVSTKVVSDTLHTSCSAAQGNTGSNYIVLKNTSNMIETDRKHVAQENTPIMLDTGRKPSNAASQKHSGRTDQRSFRHAGSTAESAVSSSLVSNRVRQSVPRWMMALVPVMVMVCCFSESVVASVQVQQQLLQQQEQQQHEQQHRVMVASDSIVAEDSSRSLANSVTSDEKPARGEDPNCAKQRLQECLALLQTLSTDHNLAFAENEVQLKEMCKTMKSGLRCVNDHVSQCFEPEHRRRIKQLLGGTQKTVQLLCNKGPLREKYLKYAPCMRNVSTDTSLCGGHYQRLISSVDPQDNLSSKDNIRRQCCAFHTYLACVGVAAESRCGTKAGQFVEEYSYRTAGPIILTRCRGYVPGSDMCIAPSSGPPRHHVTSHHTWLLLLLLLLISIAY